MTDTAFLLSASLQVNNGQFLTEIVYKLIQIENLHVLVIIRLMSSLDLTKESNNTSINSQMYSGFASNCDIWHKSLPDFFFSEY